MDDEYYLNLSPDFVERLGYMAGIQGKSNIAPFRMDVCQLRWQAWRCGYDNGYVKRMEQNN
jgi:ribosome modulation factor